MAVNMRDIVKSVLAHIKDNNLQPTPEVYKEVYCQKALEQGLKLSECNKLGTLAQKLSSDDKKEFESLNIQDVDSLFDFVVTKLKQREQSMLGSNLRISDTTLEKIASLMLFSLMPSYEDSILSSSINELSQKISQNPDLIQSTTVQDDIKELIEQRIDADQQAIADKTQKMTQLVNKVSEFIEETVNHNSNSVDNLGVINNEIISITFEELNQNTFENFKSNLMSISSQMKNAIDMLNNKLSKEKNEVTILKEKIRALESNLQSAQIESSTDFLTGVFTRRAIDKQTKIVENKFTNDGEDFIIVFIDLDNFKHINDKYSHDAGDVILSTFSKILQKKSLPNTMIGRYGGEEFVLIIKQSTISETRNFLIQIREFIHKSKFVYDNLSIKATFSAGIAQRSNFDSLESTIKEADKLLYKAKHLGRDRIEHK